MKMKFIYSIVASMFALSSFAQNEIGDRFANIDWEEDSTEVQTVSDILKMQQSISAITKARLQKNSVWGNRKFINVNLNSVKMTSDGPVDLGAGPEMREYKSNYGFSITRGKNIQLHQPIANIVAFNIDFVGIDFGVNHFKYADGAELFDLSETFTDSKVDDGWTDCYYTPWDFEKFDINYGMRIGPSVTIAPFTTIDNSMLNFVKFNVYWNWGYNVSLSIIPKDDNKDHYVAETYSSTNVGTYLSWSLRPYSVFGVNASWKNIGIGFESRSTKNEYKPLDVKYGKDTDLLNYNFKTTASRFYLQYRF